MVFVVQLSNGTFQYLIHGWLKSCSRIPQKKKKKRLQASVNKRLTVKSTWAFWISFSLNFEYIKFHIFILMWVCLCVSESPAVVRQIIFTPLLALALSQHKMDIRNAKGWMAQTVIGPCGRLGRWSCFKLSNPERRAQMCEVSRGKIEKEGKLQTWN